MGKENRTYVEEPRFTYGHYRAGRRDRRLVPYDALREHALRQCRRAAEYAARRQRGCRSPE